MYKEKKMQSEVTDLTIYDDRSEITDIQFLRREFPELPLYDVCTNSINKFESYNML